MNYKDVLRDIAFGHDNDYRVPLPVAILATAVMLAPLMLVSSVLVGALFLGSSVVMTGVYAAAALHRHQEITWTNKAGQDVKSSRKTRQTVESIEALHRMMDPNKSTVLSNIFDDLASKYQIVKDVPEGNGKYRPAPAPAA